MIVKVCGITNTRDALVSLDAGADALGFNFWPGSKRFVKETAFLKDLPEGFWRVGLFVEDDPQRVRDAMEEHGLDIAQLHRMNAVGGLRVWQAISVDGPLTQSSVDELRAEAVLLDTPAGALAGGTGKTFDWAFAKDLRGKIVLAGGLDASNVGEAVEQVRPWGIDACSRLESEPGKKDQRKVWDFVNAAREAERLAERKAV
jgi:phosphoribosylanthranilate isomerase